MQLWFGQSRLNQHQPHLKPHSLTNKACDISSATAQAGHNTLKVLSILLATVVKI